MNNRKLYALLVISVILHLSSYISIEIFSSAFKKTTSEVIEIAFLTESPESTATEDVANKATQIVETNPEQANQQIDEEARFLSAKNNKVEKETVAQKNDTFKNEAPNKTSAPLKAKTETFASDENEKLDKQPKETSKLFDTGFDVYTAMNKNKKIKIQMAKEKQTVGKVGDTSGTNDHIENVDQSLMTQLNTREYLYYGYYSRIKSQLNQWWQPKVREKVTRLMSQGRTIASEELKMTKLVIVLDNAGILVKVQVLSESGVRDLDEAAVEAFRQAAPFPNPPKGMIEADGTIRIRWDFVVES